MRCCRRSKIHEDQSSGIPRYPSVSLTPRAIAAAERAIRRPIRGGTDGSRLSEMGLPTPNLFTGGHEYHSVREWASVQDMAAAAATPAAIGCDQSAEVGNVLV